jgi:hypothetical protein
VSGHDAVTEEMLVIEPELGGAVDDERVQLLEGARVEQQVEPLPRRQLPPGVLALDANGTCIGFV